MPHKMTYSLKENKLFINTYLEVYSFKKMTAYINDISPLL